MRLLRFVITSLAVIASLIGAMAILAIGFVVFILARLFGRPATRPQFRRMSRAGTPPTRPAYSARDDVDVIEVESTPVKD